MSLLSTLRPLPQRLLERLWLILSGYVPISIEYQMTMNALNDDCLLILLETLTMPQLLQLRGVSRRLCELIERHCLRKYKTLIFAFHEKTYKEKTGEGTIRLHTAGRKNPCQNFSSRTIYMKLKEKCSKQPASMFIPLRTRAWPLSLPLLLPELSTLTLEYFLDDQVEAPTEEHLAVNRRFVPYLNSNWSTTLTALHLHIHVQSKPRPDSASFAQLNQLINLKQLLIQFTQLPVLFRFPDLMPVFGQLRTFLLHYYDGPNTAILLNQLGTDLSFLSLYEVNCSEDDLVAFLRARPNYALKTFDITSRKLSWQLFTVATQTLTSLVEFNFFTRNMTELESIFTDLSLLSNLQYISYVPLFVAQLRVLLFRQHTPGILPRLTSIRQANIAIFDVAQNGDSFQPSELFNQLLPLVSRVFCCLKKLRISFFTPPYGGRNEALSGQFSTKVGQLFPTVKSLEVDYFV